MNSEVRWAVAACVLLVLAAALTMAPGCGSQQREAMSPPKAPQTIKGRVRFIHLKKSADGYAFANPADTLVAINSASIVAWRLPKCGGSSFKMNIDFDSTGANVGPFAGNGHYVLLGDDVLQESGDVSVTSDPARIFKYRISFAKATGGRGFVVDPGIIIDDGQPKDSTQHAP